MRCCEEHGSGACRSHNMVPTSGTRLPGLLLIVLLCGFTCVALGKGLSTREVVAENLQAQIGVKDDVGGPERFNVEGAGNHKPTQRSDHTEAIRVGRVRLMAKDVMNDNSKTANNTKVGTSSNSTIGASPPIKPAPGKSKSNAAQKPPPENVPRAPAPPAQDATTGDEAKSALGGTCTREHGPVIGTLAASGGDDEDGDHDYTLTIENGGGKSQLDVTIKTSKGWKASPVDFVLTKGEMLPVTISVVDKEAAVLGARINVSWGEGDCYVDLPPENIGDNLARTSSSSLFTPAGAFALVLRGIVVLVLILGALGIWRCVSWRAHARRHGDAESKYQELEMVLPGGAALKQGDDGMSPSAHGWDEVWEDDDDWQDTEAVRSSSASLMLSSKGLNSRRANKDGWDNSWDD